MTSTNTNQIAYDGVEYDVVREGLAEILRPAASNSVFYNPIQQFNRDLSVLAIKTYTEAQPISRKRKRDASGKKAVAAKPTPRKFHVLDALSASGLRALRYAKEIPAVTSVVANDFSDAAVQAINLNIQHNKLESKILAHSGDANACMHRPPKTKPDATAKNEGGAELETKPKKVELASQFEVIDLDPYGTAAPFLDAAVQNIADGGLLCVTCTDSAVFAAAGYPEKTFAIYGGIPIKGPHSHEGGIRLILNAIAMSASKYGRAVEPLLSLSIDFYIRVFVKVRRSPQEVKLLAAKTMLVYGCDSGCGSWTTQPLARIRHFTDKHGAPYINHSLAQGPVASPVCEHCGFKTHLHGPMWGGPIHNPYFIQSMLDTLEDLSEETYGTKPRMEGMLITARDETLLSLPPTDTPSASQKVAEEAHSPEAKTTPPATRLPPHVIDDHPFFFLIGALTGALHCIAPSVAQVRGALLGLGYRVTRSHAKPGSIRTDAPWAVIWEIMREWVRQGHPIKEENMKPGTVAYAILSKSRSPVSDIRDELKTLGEKHDIPQEEIKSKLESLLYRLNQPAEDISGTETNGPKAAEQNTPLHKLKIVFDEALGKKSEEAANGKKLIRYQHNPRANWGPLSRAKN